MTIISRTAESPSAAITSRRIKQMSLSVGVAVRDISPKKPMFLHGYPHVERTSEGIHDPLLASVMCLDCRENRLITGSLDILMLVPESARELRRRVADTTNTPETNVFISCTHTHSAPVTAGMLISEADSVVPDVDKEYLEFIFTQVVEAAKEASQNLRKAELAWTSANVDGVGCNRHSPDAPRDPESGIMAVRDAATKELFAISLTYSMHPTVIHEDSRLVSADFPGYTRIHLREKFNDNLTVLYHTGPEGNQSPRHHVKGQTFSEAERLGRRLGEFIAKEVDALSDTDFTSTPELAGAMTQVSFIRKRFPNVEDARINLDRARQTFKDLQDNNAPRADIRTAECAVFGAEESFYLSKCQENGKLDEYMQAYGNLDVQALKIGEGILAGIPGEVFVEYGLEIKEKTGGNVFPVCLVNGELQGYIVTPGATGYEAGNSVFTPESGQIMVDAAVKLITELKG